MNGPTAASAARVTLAVTGVAELDGGRAWIQAAGRVGLAPAIVAGYAALALELEGSESRTVLPLVRSGASRRAPDGAWPDQVGKIATEPGVRQQL